VSEFNFSEVFCGDYEAVGTYEAEDAHPNLESAAAIVRVSDDHFRMHIVLTSNTVGLDGLNPNNVPAVFTGFVAFSRIVES
jgi:hypothetical protein